VRHPSWRKTRADLCTFHFADRGIIVTRPQTVTIAPFSFVPGNQFAQHLLRAIKPDDELVRRPQPTAQHPARRVLIVMNGA
jgi:hypothetical protein